MSFKIIFSFRRNKPKSKWRPLPLDTVELEKQASRKLRLSAKTTMNIAEKLYTQGYISYPRTETNIFPKEMNLTNIVQTQTGDQRWGGFADRILNEWNGPNPRQGKKSDQAHPPIHPIKYTADLHGDEAKVYEFIVRHFLACVSRDAVGAETTVNIDIAGEKFVGHGLSVREKNYLEVYTYERWSDKEIIDYSQIQEFEPTSIDIVDSSTEPPRLLTEADLIVLMDKHGIGTDATHAEHIETVKSREYVFTEDRDKLVPGKLAMALVEGYDGMGFAMSKPHLRAALETDLVEICEGRKTKDEVLAEQISRYKEVFQAAMDNVNKLDQATQHFLEENPAGGGDGPGGGGPGGAGGMLGLPASSPVVECVVCRQQLALKTKQSGGWMISCQGYPACRAAPMWLPSCVKDATVDEGQTCSRCTNRPKFVKIVVSRQAMAPFYPDTYSGCFGGCDPDLLEVLGVDRLNSGAVAAATTSADRRGGGGGGGSRAGHHGGRGGGQGPGGHGRGGGPGAGGSGAMPRQSTAARGAGAARGRGRGDTRGGGGGRGGTRGGGGGGGRSHGNDSGYLSSHPGTQSQEADGDTADTVHCNCGQEAVIRTVQKDGANKGRQFYVCARPREEQCQMFQWADQPVPPSSSRPGPAHQSGGGGGADSQEVNCNCGQPSAKRTVQKEGSNKGRQFYCCPKPRDEQCGFFQWEDEAGAGPAAGPALGNNSHNIPSFNGPTARGRGGAGGRGGVKRKAGGGDGGGEKRQRKCGLCHEPGHVRTKCPMKSDWNDEDSGWN